MDTVDVLMMSLTSSGLDELASWKNSTGVFGVLNDKDIKNPFTYWEMAARKSSNLSSLALKLLKIPASSAQIERVFSNWSFVHNTKRNRLDQERSKKLLFTYYTLKMQEENKNVETGTEECENEDNLDEFFT